MDKQEASRLIKEEAFRLGFSACGICRAEWTNVHAGYLKQWLDKGYHGAMSYMSRQVDKRCDPRLLVENAQSVVVVALNYYPEKKQQPQAAQIAYYAYGKDYHDVIKERLRQLYHYINQEVTPVRGRMFCDTAPLLEKYHAEKAGLGWIGHNTQLILPDQGSFFLLGEILLDVLLDYDLEKVPNRCGNCTRCMDACPTKALVAPGQLNANRCLAYLTIEYAGELPEFFVQASGNQVYGCDICIQSCPWNCRAESHTIPELTPSEALLNLTREQIESMDETAFETLFKHTPVHRIGLQQLKRNLG